MDAIVASWTELKRTLMGPRRYHGLQTFGIHPLPNLREGKCVYALGGGSQNELEARVAILLVSGLLATVPDNKQKHGSALIP